MPVVAIAAADAAHLLRPEGSLERKVTAELRRSGDQLMMPHRTQRSAATTVRPASILFIAHWIV
jgi:hypothetical protein